MIITKLEYQKKDKSRVNVYIDGKFAVGVGVDDVLSLGLVKNQQVDDALFKQIMSKSEFGIFLNTAINFLSFRPRSEYEIVTALKRKAFLLNRNSKTPKDYSQTINLVIEKLKQIGQIDDAKFASWYIAQRNTFRPKGKTALASELAKKGVPSNIYKSVLNEKSEETRSEFELAYQAASKKANQLKMSISSKRVTAFEAKIKLQRFLASRGFDWETTSQVVAKLLKKG